MRKLLKNLRILLASNKEVFIKIGIIALAVLLVYFKSLSGDFIWDDDRYVQNNHLLNSFGGLIKIWTEPAATDQHYPATFSLFWIIKQLFGLKLFAFHLASVILHALNAILVWLILRYLKVKGSFLASLIFAVHPVCVESVAWIMELKNVLYVFFYLFSCLMYLLSYDAKKNKFLLYLLSLVLFIYALFSKTIACSMPIVILLILWWRSNKVTFKDIVLLSPFFIAAIITGLITLIAENGFVVGADISDWSFSFIERCLIAGRAIWFYLGKAIWPFNLSFIYSRWVIDTHVWWQYLYTLFIIDLIGVPWILKDKVGRGPLVLVLFFIITLFPALGFFNIYPMRFSFVADHFQYLSILGPIIFVAYFLESLLEKKNICNCIKKVFLPLLILILIFLSIRQTEIYKNKLTLYNDIIKKNPKCWMAYNNRGSFYQGKGQHDLAITDFSKTLDIDDRFALVYNNRGISFFHRKEYSSALADFNKSIRVEPLYDSAYFNRAKVYGILKEYELALKDYNRVIKIKPRHEKAYIERGLIFALTKNFEFAVSDFSKAIEITPQNIMLYQNRAVVYKAMGEQAKAQEDYNRAKSLGLNVEVKGN
ncbi:MAG: tetratricopeptide repeat protein [Candidatus Zapsychrus exili]|nr:tetratricopeptide repeat protein [Candidatus Zapsychrus exili]